MGCLQCNWKRQSKEANKRSRLKDIKDDRFPFRLKGIKSYILEFVDRLFNLQNMTHNQNRL